MVGLGPGLGAASAGGAVAMPLTCSLSAPARVPAGQPLRLQFSVVNLGPQAVDLLVWGTPFDADWFAPYVDVLSVDAARGDTRLRYRGASMKRGEPAADEYLHFDAGQARTVSVDLARAFDLGTPGRYRVQPRIVLHDLVVGGEAALPRPRERHAGMVLPCQPVDIEITR